MTVRELVEALLQFPEDMPVVFATETSPADVANVYKYIIVSRDAETPAVLLTDLNEKPEDVAKWIENDRKHQAAMRERYGE